jgi:hypothetical protein
MRTSIRTGAAVAALTLLATTVVAPTTGAYGAETHAPSAEAGAPVDRGTFHDAMRELWVDHIVWTRLYIVSAATGPADLPDIGPTTDRLLANQSDIGDAIRPFYGDAAGDALTELLREHILTAAEIIAQAKGGDAEARDEAIARWYVNGDEIAAFLSAANPENWPLDAMTAHMRSHLDLTLEEAVARLEGRHADEVLAYDRVHADILEMADMLSDGIIAQFPDSFAD